jgi:GH15 family glucan-1,4-alpha-glucosidase
MIDALLQLGCHEEAAHLLVVHAGDGAHARLHVYAAGRRARDRRAGDRSVRLSRIAPVRLGNSAIRADQLDIYGALFETAWLYSERHALDADTGAVLARIADHVCDIWRQPDSGIWEFRNGVQFTSGDVLGGARSCAAARRSGRDAGEPRRPVAY